MIYLLTDSQKAHVCRENTELAIQPLLGTHLPQILSHTWSYVDRLIQGWRPHVGTPTLGSRSFFVVGTVPCNVGYLAAPTDPVDPPSPLPPTATTENVPRCFLEGGGQKCPHREPLVDCQILEFSAQSTFAINHLLCHLQRRPFLWTLSIIPISTSVPTCHCTQFPLQD